MGWHLTFSPECSTRRRCSFLGVQDIFRLGIRSVEYKNLFRNQECCGSACTFFPRQYKETWQRPGPAGQVAFGRDMGATKSLGREGQASQALEVTVACTHEVEELFKDPLRQYKFWKKV